MLATVLQAHSIWAWVVIIGNGMAGLWVLAAGRWPGLRTRALWWFVTFAELAILVQVALGLEMLTVEHRHVKFFHYFYGIVATVAIALMALYRNRLRRKLYLLYGLGGLFLMGLGIRAMIVVLAG